MGSSRESGESVTKIIFLNVKCKRWCHNSRNGATRTLLSRKHTPEPNMATGHHFYKETHPNQQKTDLYFFTIYSTEAGQIKRIMRKNWGIIERDDVLNQIFPEPPLVSFRRCATLQDKLVHSYLKPEGQQTWPGSKHRGSYKCQHCYHCGNVTQTKTFSDVPKTIHH